MRRQNAIQNGSVSDLSKVLGHFTSPFAYHQLSARYSGSYGLNVPATIPSSALNGFFFQTSALGFLLCDLFLFVGMITPQHSPLRDSVIAVMMSVFFCRFAQFAASFFRADNLSNENIQVSDDEKVHSNYRDVVFISGQIASLSLSIDMFWQMGNASAFLASLNGTDAKTPIFAMYVTFMALMAFAEFVRHLLSFLHILHWLSDSAFMLSFKIFYLLECLARLGLAFGTIALVLTHLSGENKALAAFLG